MTSPNDCTSCDVRPGALTSYAARNQAWVSTEVRTEMSVYSIETAMKDDKSKAREDKGIARALDDIVSVLSMGAI